MNSLRKANGTFVCLVSTEIFNKFDNDACALTRTESADSATCNFYTNGKTGLSVFECQARECGGFNSDLLGYCICWGGLAGAFLLFLLSGCTCAPSGELRFHARRLAEQDEEEAQNMFNQAAGDDDQDETLDLTDGIDEGEEGVILQLIAQYLDKKTEEKNPERHQNLAWFFTLLMLFKKLGLKLIVLVPLIQNNNTLSALTYFVDVFIFFYFSMQRKYFPGSLFNEVKALWSGRKFKKVALALIAFDAAHQWATTDTIWEPFTAFQFRPSDGLHENPHWLLRCTKCVRTRTGRSI